MRKKGQKEKNKFRTSCKNARLLTLPHILIALLGFFVALLWLREFHFFGWGKWMPKIQMGFVLLVQSCCWTFLLLHFFGLMKNVGGIIAWKSKWIYSCRQGDANYGRMDFLLLASKIFFLHLFFSVIPGTISLKWHLDLFLTDILRFAFPFLRCFFFLLFVAKELNHCIM